MNKVVLLGRMTKDAEIRYTPSGKVVAQFTLAVDRPFQTDGQKEADFIPCVLWGKSAEALGNNIHKGQRVLVEGRIQVRNYENNDGKKIYVTEVICNNFEFIEKKDVSEPKENISERKGFEQFGDEDIPF